MVKGPMLNFKKRDCNKITAAAKRAAKWATIITKWRIAFEISGRR